MSSNLHRFAGIQLTSVSLMYLTPLPFIYIVDTVHMRNTSMKEVALVAQKMRAIVLVMICIINTIQELSFTLNTEWSTKVAIS